MESTGLESVVRLPLLDEAARVLKAEGDFICDLTPRDLAEIVGAVLQRVVASTGAVTMGRYDTQVRIEHAQGVVTGAAEVLNPIRAVLRPYSLLGNGDTSGRICLLDLRMEYDAGMMAKMALKAFNLEERARALLADPTRLFEDALRVQMQVRGAQLTGAWLRFTENALAVRLEGTSLRSGS